MSPKPTYDELARRVKSLEAQLAAVETSSPAPSLADRILRGLFQEWETTGPPGILDIKTLALSLEISVDQIREAAEDLFTTGMVDRDRTQTALYLTPEGYQQLRTTSANERSSTVPDPQAYFRKLVPNRSPLMRKLETEAKAEEIPIVGPVEGEFLHILVCLTGAKRILELGTATGYSTLYLATALTPGKGELLTLELDPAMAQRAARNFEQGGVADRVTVQTGDALEELNQLRGAFDMIFMDIEKKDYLTALPQCRRLLKPGGLLVADNTAFRDADPFNRALDEDSGWRQVNLLAFWPGHNPEQDGVALAVKL